MLLDGKSARQKEQPDAHDHHLVILLPQYTAFSRYAPTSNIDVESWSMIYMSSHLWLVHIDSINPIDSDGDHLFLGRSWRPRVHCRPSYRAEQRRFAVFRAMFLDSFMWLYQYWPAGTRNVPLQLTRCSHQMSFACRFQAAQAKPSPRFGASMASRRVSGPLKRPSTLHRKACLSLFYFLGHINYEAVVDVYTKLQKPQHTTSHNLNIWVSAMIRDTQAVIEHGPKGFT